MMDKKEPLTSAEWVVMSALWEKAPATLSEVIKTVGDRAQWKYNTYSSYLQILIRKGFAGADTRGRDKYYYPLLGKDECIEIETRSLIGKVNKSSVKNLVINMIEQGGLTPDEHAELIALLESLMKRRGRHECSD